jgi:DNA-binding transcriptional LysR family regulator
MQTPGASLDGIDLADLRAFCLVVDLGSLTAASKRLEQTKGAISRRITRLESVLGVTLLHRSARRVQPTDEGISYRAQAGQALALLEEATSALQHERSRPRGTLRLTMLHDFGSLVIAPLLPAFFVRYPEISLEVLLTDQVLDFEENQIDVALRVSSGLKDSTMIARRLFDLELTLVASPEYLASAPPLEQPEDLYQHRLLLFRQPNRLRPLVLHKGAQDKQGTPLRVTPTVVASEGSILRDVALAGGGVTALPKRLITGDLESGRLVEALPAYQFQPLGSFYLIHRAEPFLAPKVQVFRDYLVAALGAPSHAARRTAR